MKLRRKRRKHTDLTYMKIDTWLCPHHLLDNKPRHHQLVYFFSLVLQILSSLFLSDSTKTFVFFCVGICEEQRIRYHGFHLFIQFSAHNATSSTYITQSIPSSHFSILLTSSSPQPSSLQFFTENCRICRLLSSCRRQ